jgi:hypothetical protein
LFEAQDSIGGSYIATIVEQGPPQDKYLMVRCRPDELRLFKQGEFELRELFQRSAQYGWYWAYLGRLNEPLTVDYQTSETIPDDELPAPGFRMDSANVAHDVAHSAIQDSSVVLQVVIDPPSGVSAASLGTFLTRLHQFLTHIGDYCEYRDGRFAYIATPRPRRYDMEVASLASGSATITLERPYDVAQDGTHPLSEALTVMHELLSATAQSPFVDKLIDTYSFRVAQSYFDLLTHLQSLRTGLAYTWASPQSRQGPFPYSHEFLTLDKVDWLTTTLEGAINREINFYDETRATLFGKLVMADLVSGRWRLDVYDERKVISGKVAGDLALLEQLTLNDDYAFDCIVRTPRLPRKRTLYFLTNITHVHDYAHGLR